MRKLIYCLLSFFLLNGMVSFGQPPLNRVRFFEDDRLVTVDLSTDLRKLVTVKKEETYQPADITLHFPDSSKITEPIRLSARGEFRRTECYVPSIRLDFKNTTSPKLTPLGKLKLVVGCGTHADDERLILKEFLAYKIYNLLTDMSFRVRLLKINYTDTREKIKAYTQYGFLIEDVDEMAKRNNCKEVEKTIFVTERTDRTQMTLVAIFQYMIGNTDWSVPNYHNIKLMRPVTDSFSFPYTIPYDFDFAGLVDAPYAMPKEDLGIKSVRERLYRGWPRTMEELQRTLDIFREKKEAIKKVVTDFTLLSTRYRKEMTEYIDDFYKTIDNKSLVKRIFIDDARNN